VVVRIEGNSVSISANAKEAEVVTLMPPEEKKYKVLEIALEATGDGYFSIYIGTNKICDKIERNALNIDKRRILVDWELSSSTPLKVVFTDESGSANTARYLIVFSEEAKG